MINPIEFYRYDYCTNCGTEKGIECYDHKDNPINYSLLLNRFYQGHDVQEILDRRDLSYMQCRKCRSYFRLDWTVAQVPVPLRLELKTEWLLNKFNK